MQNNVLHMCCCENSILASFVRSKLIMRVSEMLEQEQKSGRIPISNYCSRSDWLTILPSTIPAAFVVCLCGWKQRRRSPSKNPVYIGVKPNKHTQPHIWGKAIQPCVSSRLHPNKQAKANKACMCNNKHFANTFKQACARISRGAMPCAGSGGGCAFQYIAG